MEILKEHHANTKTLIFVNTKKGPLASQGADKTAVFSVQGRAGPDSGHPKWFAKFEFL